MSNIFLKVGKLLSAIIVLIVIAMLTLIIFVSPNRFKPIINEQVKKTTGRDVVLDGNLTWSFFPTLGIKTGHIAINNPSNFSERVFAEIDEAIVSIKLLPLLHGQIESEGILLKGLKLHLIKDAKGNTNWQDLSTKTSGSVSTKTATTASSKTASQKDMQLTVNALDVKNATISWVDLASKSSVNIRDFELHAKNINLKTPFPLDVNFKFFAKNPNIEGKLALESTAGVNPNQQEYLLQSSTLKVVVNGIETTIKGDIFANLQNDTLTFKNFTSKTANAMIKGQMDIRALTTEPMAVGRVSIEPFDLKAFLRTVGQNVEELTVLNPVAANLDFSFTTKDGLTANGAVSAGLLETPKLTITQLQSKMHFQNNILQLSPLTADLYQGKLNSQVTLNFKEALPKLALRGNLANIQTADLLAKMTQNQKLKLRGLANLYLDITTQGKDSQSVIQNLNGVGRINFNDGVLEGIDLGHLIDSAAALVNREEAPKSEANRTNFGNLSASIIIKNGIVTNNDLLMDAPRFNTKGKGTLDLVNQKINFDLQMQIKKISAERKNTLINLYGLVIPITINGNLQDPSIRLNGDALIKSITVQEIQNVKSQFQEKIQENLKGKAGDLLNNLLGH